MPSPGIEPGSPRPQRGILTTKLRELYVAALLRIADLMNRREERYFVPKSDSLASVYCVAAWY